MTAGRELRVYSGRNRPDLTPVYLLFERPFRGHEVVHVVDVAHWRHTAGQQGRRLVAKQGVGIDRRLRLRLQQFFQ